MPETAGYDKTARNRVSGRPTKEQKKRYKQPRELDTTRPAWFKQKGESVPAYEAFMAFLTLPVEDRTISNAAKNVGKSYNVLSRWSRQWNWALRVGTYEEHYLLLRLESVEADRDQMWSDQKILADLGMDIVRSRLIYLMDEDHPERINELKPDALVRLMAESAKIQRMSVLGRVESQRDVSEKQEALAERYADELAELIGAVVNDLGLTTEQQEKAGEVLAKRLGG